MELLLQNAVDEFYLLLFVQLHAVLGHLALTTVLTLISRLQLKGFIDLEKHGRANCAIVLADENEYKRRAAKDFVETVYKNNTKGLISALYSDGILSEDDIADLRKEIDADKK